MGRWKNWKQPGGGHLSVLLGPRLSFATQRHWQSLEEGGLAGPQQREQTPPPPSAEIPVGLAWENHFRPLGRSRRDHRSPSVTGLPEPIKTTLPGYMILDKFFISSNFISSVVL